MNRWIGQALITALIWALRVAKRHGALYVRMRSHVWRESARARWWAYKVRALETADRDDDLLAEAIAVLWKFETPPASSGWVRNGELDGYERKGALHADG